MKTKTNSGNSELGERKCRVSSKKREPKRKAKGKQLGRVRPKGEDEE